jgi:hypothetical protein
MPSDFVQEICGYFRYKNIINYVKIVDSYFEKAKM